MDAENPIEPMSAAEAWAMLARHRLGRLAFHLGSEVHLVPLNYGVTDRRIYIQTGAGSKLVGVLMNADVVFEIDEHDEHHAQSVIARGSARRLDQDEQYRVAAADIRPWVPTYKDEFIEIAVEEITGRRFFLDRCA